MNQHELRFKASSDLLVELISPNDQKEELDRKATLAVQGVLALERAWKRNGSRGVR